MCEASVPLGSSQKERLEGGHGKSPWRHVLSPVRAWNFCRQMVCAAAGGPQPGCGRHSTLKCPSGTVTLHTLSSSLSLWHGSGCPSAQASLNWHTFALAIAQCPILADILLLGRKEDGDILEAATCVRGRGWVEGRCRASGGQVSSEKRRQKERRVSPVHRLCGASWLVLEVLGYGRYLMWSIAHS